MKALNLAKRESRARPYRAPTSPKRCQRGRISIEHLLLAVLVVGAVVVAVRTTGPSSGPFDVAALCAARTPQGC
jgi:hypothetical protein